MNYGPTSHEGARALRDGSLPSPGGAPAASPLTPIRRQGPTTECLPPSRIPASNRGVGATQVARTPLRRPSQVPVGLTQDDVDVPEKTSTVLDVVGKGDGHRLAPKVRAEMEAGLGADFSDVRIHANAKAATSAAAVAAKAYTVGNEVVFGYGSFDPGRPEGKHILAHELTHVLQQREGPVSAADTGNGVMVSDPSDSFEREAEATASRVVSGPQHADSGGRSDSGAAAGVDQRTLRQAPAAPSVVSRLTVARQISNGVASIVQFPLQRDAIAAPVPARRVVSGPADLPTDKTFRVVIVGSPGKKEVELNHPFQFADAAAEAGTGATTVWLVERTGYEMGKVPLSGVQQRAGKAQVFWIDESHPLAGLLGQFRPRSIGQLEAYGHGTPGLLALRHGWPDVADYGLTTEQTKALSPAVFTDDATISFDSCNSGTAPFGESSLAQAVANATERPVGAWTGRTSYHDINVAAESGMPHPPATVKGSEIFPSGLTPDFTELWSQFRGRSPYKEVFAPQSSPGSFTSWFAIKARLPSSRTFPVADNGSVDVKMEAQSEYTIIQGGAVTVLLHRQTGGFFSGDEEVGAAREVRIGKGPEAFTWANLAAGTYFVEIYHMATGYLVEGSISVQVH
jgi:hypothetical protein